MDVVTLMETLQRYYVAQHCTLIQPYDYPMGAATFHPAIFFRTLSALPWRVAFVQPCRRPSDGRYGCHPNRLQRYYQFQVMIKPMPRSITAMFHASLATIGLDSKQHDVTLLEDNWESPTIGAHGVGWEVRCNGLEIAQITYFQNMGGQPCEPTAEITYGLERTALCLQSCNDIMLLKWQSDVCYGDLFKQSETEESRYHFEHADVTALLAHLHEHLTHSEQWLGKNMLYIAYDNVIQASHVLNVLLTRRALSHADRQTYVLRIRQAACAIAKAFIAPS
jgi:glycyl-tRNA synthetase alpha chain